MKNLVLSLARIMALVSGALLILVTAIMVVDVIGRYLFNSPLTFSVEVVELLMGLAITLSFALTTLRREHVRVDILNHFGPQWLRRGLDMLSDVASIAFFGLVAWKLFQKAVQTMGDGLLTQILGFPVFPAVYLMSFAAALAFIIALVQIFLKPSSED